MRKAVPVVDVFAKQWNKNVEGDTVHQGMKLKLILQRDETEEELNNNITFVWIGSEN